MINPKYKTSLCKNFLSKGSCPLNEKCLFAHGEQELIKDDNIIPLNQEGVQKLIENKGSKNYKTQVCRHFEIGRCKLGDICNFAHGNTELKDNIEYNNISNYNNSLQNIINNEFENSFQSNKLLLEQIKNFCIVDFNEKSVVQIDSYIKSIYQNLNNYRNFLINLKKEKLEGFPNNKDNIRNKQLFYIAEELGKLYLNNQIIIEKISNSKIILEKNLIKESAEILQNILFDTDLYEKNKLQHDEILNFAKSIN